MLLDRLESGTALSILAATIHLSSKLLVGHAHSPRTMLTPEAQFLKGKKEKPDEFVKLITCPNEVCLLEKRQRRQSAHSSPDGRPLHG